MAHAVPVAEAKLSKWGRLQHALMLGAVAIVYFLAGKLGLHFAFLHASASAVWPPTGIALAAVLLLGRRIWPAIFVGAFFGIFPLRFDSFFSTVLSLLHRSIRVSTAAADPLRLQQIRPRPIRSCSGAVSTYSTALSSHANVWSASPRKA